MKKSTYLFLLLGAAFLFPAGLSAGEITGKVHFEGTPPAPEKVDMGMDPTCSGDEAAVRANQPVQLNDDGTLKNVFVYVKEGLGGQTFEAPSEPVRLDQEGCTYNPRVFGVQAGRPVEIVNSDPTLHNVHAMPENQKPFNLGMPMQGMKIKKKFEKPEVMVEIKCDVHPWMRAYAGVVEHPYFSTTGDEGTFEIKDLPAGTYTLEAWHEKFGTRTEEITVAEDGPVQADFTFSAQ